MNDAQLGKACFALLIAIAMLPACSGDSAPAASVTRHDSAGVTIVETTTPVWDSAAAWTVGTEPFLDLTTTGTGAAHEFVRVRDAMRLADGTFVVADGGTNEVRLYAATGEWIGTFGRAGAGPGEFRRLDNIGWIRGDSLVAFDGALRRVTVFAVADIGTHNGGQAPAPRIIDVSRLGGRVVQVEPLEAGGFAVFLHDLEQVADLGRYRLQYALVTLDADGAAADTIATVPGLEGYSFELGDAPVIFGARGHLATRGDRIYAGGADSLRVDVYDTGGTLRTIMRVRGYDLRVTSEQVEAERSAMLSPELPPEIVEVIRTLPARTTRPAYARLLVDPDGYVFAPEHHGGTEADSATDVAVFAPGGEWLGHVRLPERFTALEVGADYVLGVRRDDLDTQHVQLLRLQRDR